ncbi:MAG: hypothetical protein Q8M94_11410 [Ignavibacteria bacterium]|nr:hypothetical protein [Ignavibacteria bacterium]
MTISLDELETIGQEIGVIFNTHELCLVDGIYVLNKLKEAAMLELLDGFTGIS